MDLFQTAKQQLLKVLLTLWKPVFLLLQANNGAGSRREREGSNKCLARDHRYNTGAPTL